MLAVGVYLQMRTETPEVPAAPSPVAAESLRMRSDVGAGAEPVTEKEAANDRTAGRAEQQLARDSFASPASRDAAKAAEEKAEEAPVERLQAKRALPDDKAESAPLPGAEEWLRRLHELREAGDEEAFLEQLEAFRSAYPDHPLPEGWRD
ncbi:MAG: hypothetical protein GWO03_01950 [Gammaproteobacteria bacterium]|nr:hypothetical protein [Gammaproteobacteria bacterium]